MILKICDGKYIFETKFVYKQILTCRNSTGSQVWLGHIVATLYSKTLLKSSIVIIIILSPLSPDRLPSQHNLVHCVVEGKNPVHILACDLREYQIERQWHWLFLRNVILLYFVTLNSGFFYYDYTIISFHHPFISPSFHHYHITIISYHHHVTIILP